MQASFPRFVLTAVALAAAASAGAQEGPVAATQGLTTAAPEPGEAWTLGEGVRLYPSVSAGLGYNDNVTGVSTGKIGSSTLSLKPRLVAEARQAASRYTLAYQGDYTRYNSSTTDNALNHTLEGAGDHDFSARSRLGWALNYADKVDPRDSTSPTADTWRGLGARAVYRYGAQGAQGNLETEYAYFNKRYDDVSARDGDLDSHLVAGRFFWRLMPKTYMVLEGRYGDTDYPQNAANQNTDTRLLVGLTWDATAKTSGSVKLGHQKRDYSGKSDYSGSTYEAAVKWAPLTYSTVTLTARRSAEDSTDAGVNFQKTDGVSLGWVHQWNSRLSTRASLSDNNRTDVGTTRKDSTLGAGLGMSYQIGRQYSLGVDYNHTDNDSNAANSAYKRNTLLVSLQAQL